jgi:hypothetical protein
MNAETQKVNVLMVLDKHIAAERSLGYEASAREGYVARAAVAELIEADHAFDVAKAAFDAACRPATHTHRGTSPKHGDPVVATYHEAQRRRNAALVRVSNPK